MARVLAVVVGIAALILAFFATFAPLTIGRIGVTLTARDNRFVAASVAAGSPADRAGLRAGDVVDFSHASFEARRCMLGRWCSRERGIAFRVGSAQHERTVVITPAAAGDERRVGQIIDLTLNVLYVAFGAAILMRAPRTRLCTLVVWLLMLYAFNNGTADYDGVAFNASWEYVLAGVGQAVSVYAIGVCAVTCICSLNTQWPRLRAIVARSAFIAGFSGLYYEAILGMVLSIAPIPALYTRPFVTSIALVSVAVGLCIGTALFTLASSGPEDERVRNRWFASTLVACFFFGYAGYRIDTLLVHNESVRIFLYYFISFACIGPVYATLRHHLIDLDVALSRSAVFGIVSAVLLLGFATAEWIAGKISDSIAGDGRWQGIAAQLFSFAAAIAIGLGLRQLHSRTERSVNAIVFRDRERRLQLLRQFAREVDVVQDRAVLAKVTYDALAESLETNDFAIYLVDGDGFACVRSSNDAAPERLTSADRPVLTVLRDAGSFVSATAPLRDWLIVPLTARTSVVGFLACGPKGDRTRYLAEELDALATVAQHVGTSYAMLPAAGALV